MSEIAAPTTPIDPTTNQAIDDYQKFSQTPVGDVQQQKMQGVSEAAQSAFGSPDRYHNSQLALGMDDGGMNSALENRYRAQAGDQVAKLGVQSQYEAQIERAQRMAKSMTYLQARQNVTNSAYKAQLQAYQDNMKARNSVLSSVLQIVPVAAMFL